MKKISILIVFLVLMTAITAHAEVKAGSVSVTPFVGGYFFDKNQGLKDAPIFGLRAGYNFTENMGLEGFVSYVPSKAEAVSGKPKENVYGCSIEGLYHFMPESRIVPFISLGFGGIHSYLPYNHRRYKPVVDFGVGLKYFVTDNIALRADLRQVLPMSPIYTNLQATLGVSFAFGGQKKDSAGAKVNKTIAPIAAAKVQQPPAPVEVISASGKAGVPDNIDKVPVAPVNPVAVAAPVAAAPLLSNSLSSSVKKAYPYTIHSMVVKKKLYAQIWTKKIGDAIEPVFITPIILQDSGLWFRLDAGLFSSKHDAADKLAELKPKGILGKTAFIGSAVKLTIGLGVFKTREDAATAVNRLSNKGISAYIIDGTDGSFRVVCGAFSKESEASFAIEELERVGINGKLESR